MDINKMIANELGIGKMLVTESGIEKVVSVDKDGYSITELFIPRDIFAQAYKKFVEGKNDR